MKEILLPLLLVAALAAGLILLPKTHLLGGTIVQDTYLYSYKFPTLSSPDGLLDVGDAFQQADGTWYVHLAATSTSDYYGPMPKGMTIQQFTIVTAVGGETAVAVFKNNAGATVQTVESTTQFNQLTPSTTPTLTEQIAL